MPGTVAGYNLNTLAKQYFGHFKLGPWFWRPCDNNNDKNDDDDDNDDFDDDAGRTFLVLKFFETLHFTLFEGDVIQQFLLIFN